MHYYATDFEYDSGEILPTVIEFYLTDAYRQYHRQMNTPDGPEIFIEGVYINDELIDITSDECNRMIEEISVFYEGGYNAAL